MHIAKAYLIDRADLFRDEVPLGKEYRVDIDSIAKGTCLNTFTGKVSTEVLIMDTDANLLLPRRCLHIEGLEVIHG